MNWQARWIWGEQPAAPGTILSAPTATPPARRNRFYYLRRSFELSSIPRSVPARVTADSRFVLYVNEAEVARGPARSLPERLAYAEADLAAFLRPGRNVIAALVRFYGVAVPWWRPAAPSLQLGYGSFAFEAPSIGIVSDAAWKAMRAPYQQEVPQSGFLPNVPIEIVNGALVPRGWSGVEFDDSGWDPAAELSSGGFSMHRTSIPAEPYYAPEPDQIASLTAIAVELRQSSVRGAPHSNDDAPIAAYPATTSAEPLAAGDRFITFDAGGITLATPWIEVTGERGAIADVYVGEDLRADGAVQVSPRFYALRYRLAGKGNERVEAFETVGFRYLTVALRGGAELRAAGAIERRYPRGDSAFFECDDERLNRLWRIGARTLDLCSTDAFFDCPGREQRAWLGDSYIHALLTYVTSTDWRLVRRHLRISAHSQRGDGLLAMVAVGDASLGATTIPDYSLHWIRALARNFEYSGDAGLVRELMPAATLVMRALERHRAADGMIHRMPGWVFIDWAMTERAEITGALDALYAAALNDYAMLLERVAGDSAGAARARAQAERTRRAFECLWDEERGVYVDAAEDGKRHRRVSQHTNAAAILGGCAPRERWTRMLDYVLDESRLLVTPTISDNPGAYVAQRLDPAEYMAFDAERNVVAAQPFFSHFVHQAVAAAGRRGLIPRLCMRWWAQVERGDTAFEEYWDARAGTGSRCHAWSATPTFDLTAHVLGVRPLAPGFAQVEIRPRFGALARLRAAVPTPHGLIELELERERGGSVTIPPRESAEVSFEDAPLASGRLESGTHRIVRV